MFGAMAVVVGSMLLQRSTTSSSRAATASDNAEDDDEDHAPRAPAPQPQQHFNSDSARKRRKYIPGGPGGGGRFVDVGTSLNPETPSLSLPSLSSAASRRPRSTPRRSSQRPDLPQASTLLSPSSPMQSPVASHSRPSRRDRDRGRTGTATPTYDSAAEAAAAAVQGDGYKPREERSWEEFHPDLDLDVKLAVFAADEVDGMTLDNSQDPATPADGLNVVSSNTANHQTANVVSSLPRQAEISLLLATPQPRKRGRPPRRPESMLSGLGSPPAQKITPIPAHNPRERLTLPKPSYRKVEAFTTFEMEKGVSQNYVDQAMANVGYQKNDLFHRPEKQFIRLVQNSFGDNTEDSIYLEADGVDSEEPPPPPPTVGQVEYDMDEQDQQWLDAHNSTRKNEGVDLIRPQIFEITMTQIEKEWHALEKRIPKPNPKPPQTQRPRSSSAAAVNGEPASAGEDQDSKCAVCDDGDCENTNAIVFCDGCDLAVHQECYGVPFIPEGQWLCRKCQLVGRATPTCIFCPNTDGAFKLTHESRWAHLLCAIWIPEVTLANTTFMEPIMDVTNIPKQRWKLNCYICHQRMGACIQCGNRNCFQAFHVTCARRAKLYLKMKSSHGGPATFDASVLKAFCDKHVPSEWRREHNVERATVEAKAHYRREMKGRKWADSQQSALALVPTQQTYQPVESIETPIVTDESSAAAKKKREQAQKNVWRLPSGAPIVPHIVFNNVEVSLQRFTLRRRKEFVAEACKYWTLKREARRGAALLKRLQLQMETFSTMEIARRNFAGLGAAGGPKLQRRIDFALQLETQMDRLLELCDMVVEREGLKLQDAELLKHAVDTIYFPVTPLLWPVLQKAQSLDSSHNIFADGFRMIQQKLEHRMYTSVSSFSADLGSIFRSVVGLDSVNNAAEAHNHLAGVSLKDASLTNDQKEVKKLAKRIIKAIHPPLQDALRSEAELVGKPFEKELHRLDAMLGDSIEESQVDVFDPLEQEEDEKQEQDGIVKANQPNPADEDVEMVDVGAADDEATTTGAPNGVKEEVDDTDSNLLNTPSSNKRGANDPNLSETKSKYVNEEAEANAQNEKTTPESTVNLDNPSKTQTSLSTEDFAAKTAAAAPSLPHRVAAPLTPPASEKDLLAPLSQGGIPWYLEPFDPIGTTIQDERWTGREVLRGMSEELSEIDEEELKGLGADVDDEAGTVRLGRNKAVSGGERAAGSPAKSAAAAASASAAAPASAPTPPPQKKAATPAPRRRKRKGW